MNKVHAAMDCRYFMSHALKPVTTHDPMNTSLTENISLRMREPERQVLNCLTLEDTATVWLGPENKPFFDQTVTAPNHENMAT